MKLVSYTRPLTSQYMTTYIKFSQSMRRKSLESFDHFCLSFDKSKWKCWNGSRGYYLVQLKLPVCLIHSRLETLQCHLYKESGQRLVSEPDPSQEEEGSGHSPTFELSPGRNVDLANQNCWLQMTSWKWFFSRLSVLPATRYGKSLRCSMFNPSTWGEQRADRQWTYAWCRHRLLITHA